MSVGLLVAVGELDDGGDSEGDAETVADLVDSLDAEGSAVIDTELELSAETEAESDARYEAVEFAVKEVECVEIIVGEVDADSRAVVESMGESV